MLLIPWVCDLKHRLLNERAAPQPSLGGEEASLFYYEKSKKSKSRKSKTAERKIEVWEKSIFFVLRLAFG